MVVEKLEEENENQEDPVEYLSGKAQKGVFNIIEEILRQPVVQKALIKQSVESGLFISCLIVGILTIVNALKQALNISWQVDVAIGISLIIIFIVYVKRKLNM